MRCIIRKTRGWPNPDECDALSGRRGAGLILMNAALIRKTKSWPNSDECDALSGRRGAGLILMNAALIRKTRNWFLLYSYKLKWII